MIKEFNFHVNADASTKESTANELMAIKAALGFILAKLPPDAQADVVQNMINLPSKEAKDLGSILNQFRNLHLPD
ncbi:hypothetical protein P0E69_09710 [Chimaeribacter arupi]|uniref:Uncharacterized protein n=1 Tax=Nissabacter archeti TaxID=1917880 RepID=A0ABS5JCI8_9GAMM|nr:MULTISPECIES: hypothetical protein [Yersiniaceae]MBS0967679.1 hypothetical protein [Nissabacter archeti]WKZ94118.1 hypothetical protein P0E69_09710 [Chimaeribacter arupi]